MFTNLDQTMAVFVGAFGNIGLTKGILFATFFLAIWFLPSILAVFLNREHLGKIVAANVPAGLSWVVWVALLVWAVTGKMRVKRREKEAKASAESAS